MPEARTMTLAQAFMTAGLDWLVPAWSAPANVHAFATTRNDGRTGSLDLGPAHLATLDATAQSAIAGHRARVAAFLPSSPVWLEQVHGTGVVTVDEENVAALRERAPIADAAVTRLAGVPLAVRVADCLPVLLADERGSVVAVAHAGWRGLAAGIVEATVAATQAGADRLIAWLGPAIGARAFEVGDDVRDAFRAADTGAHVHFVAVRPGKWLADLSGLARDRLARAGVRRIVAADRCTFSEPGRFFSYRRDRGRERMAAFVWR